MHLILYTQVEYIEFNNIISQSLVFEKYDIDLKNDLQLVCQIKRLIIEITTTEATWSVRKWTEI